MSENEPVIRFAVVADAERLLEIYAPYVRNTAVSFEYSVPSKKEFEGRIKETLKKYPYLVAELDGRIAGYAYASAFKEREAYNWSVETSIYIDSGLHGRGIGSSLYVALENCLKKQNVLNLNACIAYPNPDSIAFHEKHGYRTVGHFTKCGYKFGTWYDMIWMEKMLGEHRDEQPAFVPLDKIEEKNYNQLYTNIY